MMNEEMLLNEEPEFELLEVDQFDENNGDLYTELWNWQVRNRPSFEVLGTVAGVQKGSIEYTIPEHLIEYNVYNYLVEVASGTGEFELRLYKTIEEVAKFLNNNSQPPIKKYNNKLYFEFPKGIHQSANAGVVRIGLLYRKKNGWVKHIVSPPSSTPVHITMDAINNKNDIEVMIITKDKHIALGTYRRDLPIINPNTYKQYLVSGAGVYSLQLFERETLEIDKVHGTQEGNVAEIWVRFIK